jgi:hypothetical protein
MIYPTHRVSKRHHSTGRSQKRQKLSGTEHDALNYAMKEGGVVPSNPDSAKAVKRLQKYGYLARQDDGHYAITARGEDALLGEE